MSTPNRKALRLSNGSELEPIDLLTWLFVEMERSGTPSEQFIARAMLDETMDRTIYRVTDERFEEDDDGIK